MDLNDVKNRLDLLSGYDPKKGLSGRDILPEHRELMGHMIIEAWRHHIYETHGYVNNITEILERLYNYVVEYCTMHIPDMLRKSKIRFKIPPKIFDDIENKPFDKILIDIEAQLSPCDDNTGGYYDSRKSGITEEGSVVKAHLNLTGLNFNDYRNQIYTILGHELVHGLEGNNRIKYNPDSEIDRYEDVPDEVMQNIKTLDGKFYSHDMTAHNFKSQYGHIVSLLRQYPNEYMFQFLYMTDKTEINAFIGEVRSELELLQKPLDSPHDYLNYLTNTDGYSRLEHCQAYLKYVNEMFSKHPFSAQSQNIISAYTAATGDNSCTTYNQLWKKLFNRFDNFQSQAMKQLPKIAYDAYCDQHNINGSKYEVPIIQTNKIGHKRPGDDLD